MTIPSIPFKILALAPFKFEGENPWAQGPISIDKLNIDQVMENLGLSLYVPLSQNLCPSGGLTIDLKQWKDFHPDHLILNNPFLNNLLEAKQFIEEAKKEGQSIESISSRLQNWPNLPVKIRIEQPKSKSAPATSIDHILKMVSMPEEGQESAGGLSSAISQIDSVLQQILELIFSHKDFRNMESTWQGLKLLLDQGIIDGEVLLEMVPVSFDTVEETLNKLLLSLIEEPPSLFVIDLPFDNSPRSLSLLEKIADFSETFLTPAICWITSEFFHLSTWEDLKKLSYLPHYLDDPPFAKWRRLKGSPSARWLAMTCNRFLVRYPYGPDNKPRVVRFEESQSSWVSPVWALAALIGKSLVRNGWPTRFTEWKYIRIENLASLAVKEDKSLSTETAFSEDRIDQFSKAGIIPLVSMPNQDIAFTPVETTSSGVSLSHQLFVSRITHLFLWCKDHFENDITTNELEARLKNAFSIFWEKTGYQGPKYLEISAEKESPEKPLLVRVMIEPSREILLSGKKVELLFHW